MLGLVSCLGFSRVCRLCRSFAGTDIGLGLWVLFLSSKVFDERESKSFCSVGCQVDFVIGCIIVDVIKSIVRSGNLFTEANSFYDCSSF